MTRATRLTYSEVGATRPADAVWSDPPAGMRAFERTAPTGSGDAHWEAASADLLRWGVKTRSGFAVERSARDDGAPVRRGEEIHLRVSLGPLVVREPVRVVAVVDEPDRRGFAYGTLEGHPVSGEEAFVLGRDPDGGVHLVLRSLTRPAPGPWRLASPRCSSRSGSVAGATCGRCAGSDPRLIGSCAAAAARRMAAWPSPRCSSSP